MTLDMREAVIAQVNAQNIDHDDCVRRSAWGSENLALYEAAVAQGIGTFLYWQIHLLREVLMRNQCREIC